MSDHAIDCLLLEENTVHKREYLLESFQGKCVVSRKGRLGMHTTSKPMEKIY